MIARLSHVPNGEDENIDSDCPNGDNSKTSLITREKTIDYYGVRQKADSFLN